MALLLLDSTNEHANDLWCQLNGIKSKHDFDWNVRNFVVSSDQQLWLGLDFFALKVCVIGIQRFYALRRTAIKKSIFKLILNISVKFSRFFPESDDRYVYGCGINVFKFHSKVMGTYSICWQRCYLVHLSRDWVKKHWIYVPLSIENPQFLSVGSC